MGMLNPSVLLMVSMEILSTGDDDLTTVLQIFLFMDFSDLMALAPGVMDRMGMDYTASHFMEHILMEHFTPQDRK